MSTDDQVLTSAVRPQDTTLSSWAFAGLGPSPDGRTVIELHSKRVREWVEVLEPEDASRAEWRTVRRGVLGDALAWPADTPWKTIEPLTLPAPCPPELVNKVTNWIAGQAEYMVAEYDVTGRTFIRWSGMLSTCFRSPLLSLHVDGCSCCRAGDLPAATPATDGE